MRKINHKDPINTLINVVIYINLLVLLSTASAKKQKDNQDTSETGIARFGPIIDPSTIEYIDLEQVDEYFNHFNMFYKAEYRNSAHIGRSKKRFVDNVKRILIMNKFAVGVQYRINEFDNLTLFNFTKTHTGFNDTGINNTDVIDFQRDRNQTYPRILDWRTLGLNNHVKHQGYCKSSYVFSAVANIAAQYARVYGIVPSLSEQQGINCELTGTCTTGGMPHDVMEALRNAGGVVEDSSTSYDRYEPTVEKLGCEINPTYAVVTVTKVIRLQVKHENYMIAALNTYGPLVTAIYVSESIKHYHSGVLDPSDCNQPPNHNVLLVGYGETENRVQYWILMNSWGTMWGEQGFFRLVRGKHACNIGTYLATTTVEKYTPSVPATQLVAKQSQTGVQTTAKNIFQNRARMQDVPLKDSDSSDASASKDDVKKSNIKSTTKRVIQRVSNDKFWSVDDISSSVEGNTKPGIEIVRASVVETAINSKSDAEEDEESKKKEKKDLGPRITAIPETFVDALDDSYFKAIDDSEVKKKILRMEYIDKNKHMHKKSTPSRISEESSYESAPVDKKIDIIESDSKYQGSETQEKVLADDEPEVRVTKGIWDFSRRFA